MFVHNIKSRKLQNEKTTDNTNRNFEDKLSLLLEITNVAKNNEMTAAGTCE
jgi:hypothetical protein